MSDKIVNHNYSKRTIPEGGFKTFDAFYPYYLSEHCHRTNRRLHIIGTSISVFLFILAVVRKRPNLLLTGLIQGYAWAWIGHFFFEKNKPATFKYPAYSLRGDFKMWAEVLSGPSLKKGYHCLALSLLIIAITNICKCFDFHSMNEQDCYNSRFNI